ncbi:zinc dependent phospholipase C family protein [Metaclostridioides mangenotii]|uniref:zinc dependent phospholipase C family protein n=1 Tax=Metaclostridioides mangenotii TaxID=1540 RepID=UPI00046708B7|nr:zinc dependent phospholipase C family protein [Clostridioides mangenotii]
MLMNTHFTIARSILENMDDNKNFFLSDKNFIYGNIKPDAFSKYKLKKHYMEESLDMVVEKIKHLSSLTLDYMTKYFSISRLSQELGVICHFLCDFFCIAHNERWEFKHSMNRHVVYERELSSVAKEIDFSIFKPMEIKSNFETFFNNLYKEYEANKNHYNDLRFSTYMCKSVVNYILDNILSNTVASYNIANCG